MKVSISKLLILPFLFLLSATVANAGRDDGDKAAMATLQAALKTRLPSLKIDRINPTPLEGLFQVVVGSEVVYMDEHAEYMIDGDLVSLVTKKNYSEQAKSKIRLAALADLGENNMLVYHPEKEDFHITVVTDIDCPYCRRLHAEVPQYLQQNVAIRYIFLPLKGDNDRRKTESVWCAEDPRLALDIAKAGGDVETAHCDNPIDKMMKTARKLGVRGTPAIVLESGEMLPGYVPVDKLVAELRRQAAEKTGGNDAKADD